MPDVAVREGIVQLQVEDIERPIGERIALIGVVVHIFRKHIVPFELISLAESLSHAGGEAVVERLAYRTGHNHIAKARKQTRRPVIQETSKVDAFRMREVKIQ